MAEGLFAGVADGFLWVEGWGGVEVGEDGIGHLGEFGGVGEGGGVDGEEELGEAGFLEGVEGELVGAGAAGEHGGEHVEGEREAGAFPEADGEGALGLLDGFGVAGEVAVGVVAAGDGEFGSALGVGGERTHGELGGGHVEDYGCFAVRDGEDDGVVADGWFGGAPGGGVGEGVGPADGEEAFGGGLPAVGAAAHPMVGVGEGHGPDAVPAGEGDGLGHGGVSVEVAGAEVAVPALDGSEA